MKYIKIIIVILFVTFITFHSSNVVLSKGEGKEKEQYVWGNKGNYNGEEIIIISDNVDFTTFEGTDYYPKVKKIILEEGIENLGRFVFFPFPNVKDIVFPSSLEDIGRAFHTISEDEKLDESYFLSKLENIEVNQGNPYYLSINGVLYSKDQTCLLHYPSSKNDKDYIMPEFVTTIEKQAFGYNLNLEKIVFGARFLLGDYPFSYYGNLPNLQAFDAAKDNIYYTVEGGVWFNYDKTILIAYPQGKKQKRYIIPSTVKDIKNDSFKYALIDTLVLPSGLISFYEVNFSEPINPSFLGDFISNYEITNNPNYETVDGVLYNKEKTQLIAWSSKKSVEHLKFPSTLTSLNFNESTIPNIRNIKKITIPRDLKVLNTEIWYPLEAQNGNYNIARWDSLESIELDQGNKNFTLYDGILYTKSKMKLVLLPPKSEKATLTIPENCERSKFYRNYLPTMPSVTKIIITGDGYNFPYELFPNLTNLELSKGNKKAKLVDGVLYSSSQKTLIWYPQNKKGTSFTIPSSVTALRNDTLEIQNYLETIILPKNLNLTVRGDGTWFLNCKKLKQIKVASNNPYITAIDGVLYDKKKSTIYCYPSAKTATSYTMPDTVVYFYLSENNHYLKSLQIGKNFGYFYYCGKNNFYLEGFTKLESITVKNNICDYISVDGVLYKKDFEKLRLKIYPQAKKDKSFVIKENVSRIDCSEVLLHHKYLKKITSNSSVINVVRDNILHFYELY